MRNDTITLVQLLRKQGKRTGDIVHIKRRPHYIYEIREDNMTFVSMDERKVFVTLWDKQPCTKTN